MPTNDEYRRGFIDGAVMCGATLEEARWAAEADMGGARVIRDEFRASGDERYIPMLQHFVAEARMWSQIARRVISQNRME